MKMGITIDSIIYLILTAFLWGVTNPFMKSGAKGIETVEASSFAKRSFKEFSILLNNAKYLVPCLINYCGSVLYFFVLQNTDLSLAVPVTNSLTFVFTALTGWIMGEEKVHRSTYAGIIFIVLGTALCCLDKADMSS